MAVDKFSRFPVIEAPMPTPVLGESQAGQRHIDDYRQGGNPQGKPECFQSEHRILLVCNYRVEGICVRRQCPSVAVNILSLIEKLRP
jgi:hypothetical protein